MTYHDGSGGRSARARRDRARADVDVSGARGGESARGSARSGSRDGSDRSPHASAVGSAGRLRSSTLWDDDDIPAGPQPLRARWAPVPESASPSTPRRRRSSRRRSGLGWFFHHYGWRAYALPVLAALTVAAVVGIFTTSSSGEPGGDVTGAHGSVTMSGSVTVTIHNPVPTTVTKEQPGPTTTVHQKAASGAADASAADGPSPTALTLARTGVSVPVASGDPSEAFDGVVMGLLPDGPPFARTGAGTFHIVPGTSKPFGHGSERRTFTIEVEDGIETPADDATFADDVMQILRSGRSWVGTGDFTLQRIDSGEPDFRVTLTSQMTIRQPDRCGWDIRLEASCYNRIPGRVFINDARWVRGAAVYGGDLASYRVYAINHEVGHALGQHHQPCPVDNGLAPVMMQQSWSTSDDDLAKLSPGGPVGADGKVCRYNPFVDPKADPGPVSG